jgi:hypothetical protein
MSKKHQYRYDIVVTPEGDWATYFVREHCRTTISIINGPYPDKIASGYAISQEEGNRLARMARDTHRTRRLDQVARDEARQTATLSYSLPF